MEKKLLIGVLGNLGSGKTTTWNKFFNRNVHTGKNIRKIEINGIKIPVFLISTSPLERKTDLKYILPEKDPQIVICSFLYHKKVKANFEYFISRGYELYIQWLNPGFNDANEKFLFYNDGIINELLSYNATVSVKNAKTNESQRIEELKNFIFSWYVTNSKTSI